MQPKHEDSKFKAWLDTLQQESWQLELIISGVAIFGLISSFEPLYIFIERALRRATDFNYLQSLIGVFFSFIYLSLLALTISLIIHIVLRGLWIGAIGLRYFSGDIDYEYLRYSSRFKSYLQGKIGSFDKYISKLEDACSLVFAISFLLVFFFISFFLSLLIAAIPFYLIDQFLSAEIGRLISIILVIFIGSAYVITFLDFFTQGYFKRSKWLSRIYFPIYRIMSRVTLSFIYRPLLYNLLDNKLGKRILFVLVPIFIGISWIFGLSINESNYHISDWNEKAEYANWMNYEDLIEDEERQFVHEVSIPSKIIKNTSMPVFLKHRGQIEDVIIKIDSTLKPIEDLRGLKSSGFIISINSKSETDHYDKFQKYLKILEEEVVTVTLDTTKIELQWILSSNKKGQRGYETVIDLSALTRGLHTLHIQRKRKQGDTLANVNVGNIPFWYYPD